MMITMSVVLTRFASWRVPLGGIEGIRVGFGTLPNIVAGIMLGPLYGAVAGALSDIVGILMSPMGGFMPHFTLTATLAGFIPGLVFHVTGGREQPAAWGRLACCMAAGNILVSLGLTPYFLWTLYGMDYRVIMIPRIIAFFLEVPAYTVVAKGLLTSASSLGLFPRQSSL